jgi:diguanylate cyclase (GGDEF)-like protein
VEPVFLVVARAFSADEMARILRRGNLFMLPRTSEGSGRPTGFARFMAALEKVFVDFDLQGRLARYVADDLQSFAVSERLRSTKEEVERANAELTLQNRVDELTKLLNRRGIIESMRVAKGRAGRERWRLAGKADQADPLRPAPAGEINEFFGHLSCMMVDVDHFKRVNDTYGHLVGDDVLRTIGKLFQRKGIFRAEDICGRYGGEEFTVILPATSAMNAVVPADKFRAELSRLSFAAENGEKFQVTASIGIAELSDSEETIDQIISKADAALYRAKENGRNLTVVYDEAKFTHEDIYRAAEKHGGDIEELEGR